MRSNDQNIFDLSWLKVGLWATAFSFVLFYLILAYNNRIASDDLYFVTNLSNDGFFGSILRFKYNQRLTSHLLYNLIFVCNTDLKSLHWQLFFFHIASITGILLSVKYLMRNCFKVLLNFPVSKGDTLLLSALFTGALFFFTFQLNEVWFWSIASVIHLIPLIFIFFGIGHILQKKAKLSSFVLIFMSFLFVGGASETIALSVIVLLSVSVFTFAISKSISKSYRKMIPHLITALMATSFLFLFNILSGNSTNRITFESMQNNSSYIYSLPDFLGSFIQIKNLVFLLFLFLFFILGNQFYKKGLQLKGYFNRKTVILVILSLSLITLATFAPLYYVFDSLGPQRAWSPFGAGIVTFLIVFSFYLGNRKNIKQTNVLYFIAPMLVTAAILFYVFRQTPIVFEYSRAYDKRTESLLELNRNGQKDPVGVAPLPSSGMLINSRLETSPDGWHNEMLRMALDLNFSVYALPQKENTTD